MLPRCRSSSRLKYRAPPMMFWRGSNGSDDAHLFGKRGHELHEALRAGGRHDQRVERGLGPHHRANQLGIEAVPVQPLPL